VTPPAAPRPPRSVGELVLRLAAFYRVELAAVTVAAYAEKLGGYPAEIVDRVVEDWIDTKDRFPEWSKLRELIRARMPKDDVPRFAATPEQAAANARRAAGIVAMLTARSTLVDCEEPPPDTDRREHARKALEQPASDAVNEDKQT